MDVLDELAAVDIVISYHLFVDILGAPTRRGREAAREFVTRFAKKWIEPTVTFHECIVEGDRVVLIWSFSAESSSSVTADDPAREDIHRWGGITLIRFDKDGHVVAEIGQESTPGPMARIAEVEP